MVTQIELGDISVDVLFKDIKNVHLGVYPPTGRVRISAPNHMSIDKIRVFAISKLGWIKAQQKKLVAQERETPREFLERESHYLWGNRYLLELENAKGKTEVAVTHKKIVITSAKPLSQSQLSQLMDDHYREALRLKAFEFISRWEKRLDVTVKKLFIQRMKTKWGGCNPTARNIRINLDLAKKAPECLDYIILHEMLHFFVPNHGPKFVELMDQYMPHWRNVRRKLNATPLSHVDWTY
ncbi:M48 family metallopeptidase [Thalassospira aquimaris]|uniref:SprT family zinc-dependent metalloprotease n=1 Tax=Thalassospira aquimaris TaxID=3037796 RepID=A0ABT6GF61_9PROT|nr:SprT family zinc-dependent metalloprotease [Thalassospira sp. FZY0004]MDG4720721.1 SprT family zinc-dependent metalloprotease [Thalassospira sp. FZY0004]